MEGLIRSRRYSSRGAITAATRRSGRDNRISGGLICKNSDSCSELKLSRLLFGACHFFVYCIRLSKSLPELLCPKGADPI